MAIIKSWYGKLGNNILQIGNALTVAYLNRSVFSCPTHSLFPSFSVPFGYVAPTKGNYFSLDFNDHGGAQKFLKLRSDLLKEHFLPKLNLPKLNEEISNLIKNGALVTHARGGDSFHTPPHPKYIPHPLGFYLHLATLHEKVVLVYEDETNPVVRELYGHPKFYTTSSDVLTDFAILAEARAVALGGFGTFVPSACLLNKGLTKVYYSSVAPIDEYIPDSIEYKKIFIDLKGYVEEGQWIASADQKKLMLSYNMNIE